MVQPRGIGGILLRPAVHQRPEHTLRNDRADFARRGTEPVRCGAVSGWETLTRNNKGRRVGSEVEEELGNDIEGQQAVVGMFQFVEPEPDGDKQDGQD